MRVANKKPRFVTQEPAPAAAGKPLRDSISGNDETVDPNDGKAEETIFSVEKGNNLTNIHDYFRYAKVDVDDFAELTKEWMKAECWEERFDLMLHYKDIPYLLMQYNNFGERGLKTQVLHHFTRRIDEMEI